MWKIDVPDDNEYNNDLLVFARETNARFINLVENQNQSFTDRESKVWAESKVFNSLQRNRETQYMEHYFRENDPHEDQILN